MSKIIGEEELMATMNSLADLKEPLTKAIRKWSEYVRGEAVDLCPVKTGELRRSIKVDVQPDPNPTGIIFTTKEYAPFVEFGTGRRGEETSDETSPEVQVTYSTHIAGQAAQPFLYPALNNNKERILKGIQNDLRGAIKT